MVAPEREPLAGLVEVDETSIPFRGKDEPVRPGRAHEGKLLIAGAVEIKGKGPGRDPLAGVVDDADTPLNALVRGNRGPGSSSHCGAWPGIGDHPHGQPSPHGG